MTESPHHLFADMGHQDGQTMVEYAVVLAVVAIAVAVALTALAGSISTVLASVTSAL